MYRPPSGSGSNPSPSSSHTFPPLYPYGARDPTAQSQAQNSWLPSFGPSDTSGLEELAMAAAAGGTAGPSQSHLPPQAQAQTLASASGFAPAPPHHLPGHHTHPHALAGGIHGSLPPITTLMPSPSQSSQFASPHMGNGSTPDRPDKSQVGAASVERDGEDGEEGEKVKNKKKRKKKDKDGKDDKDKRAKTGRACDACRSKKIRCDILKDESPHGVTALPICAHCKSNDLECTFFLPITETRFKKRTGDSTAPAPTTAGAASVPSQPSQSPVVSHALKHSTPTGPASNSPNYDNVSVAGSANGGSGRTPSGRVEGPTSISFLLHTTIPAIPSEAYDLRQHTSWEVLEDGNGLIRVNAPPRSKTFADADPQDPTKAHNRLNRPVLGAQTMSLLVNAYFNEVAPLFPIVSRAEFAAKANPNPLLLYAICGLGATRRQFPKEVFTGVRGVINGLMRSNDILSDARLDNVQALLLLAQVGDLHAQPTASTASASLIRTGVAIRMAQDLGLHRESSHDANTPVEDLPYIELRRRIWACCVIMDRWYGAALGIPLLIDLLDCDVLMPAAYEIVPGQEPVEWVIDPSFLALGEQLKLAIIIGKVLKTVYSPTGIKHATDTQLKGLVKEMMDWKDNLPEMLQFNGKESSHVAALLHMSYAAVQFLFWRVFMRINYSCPPHLQFLLDVQQWTKMVLWSREALQWLNAHDDALDTVFIYSYTATSCALIQYHTWARRGDQNSLEMLKLVKETSTRWESIAQPDQMSIRRKTCETMTLLYESALKTNPSGMDHTLSVAPPSGNPTAGVNIRKVPGKVMFLPDPSRPSGGVYVAPDEAAAAASGLDEKDVVLEKDLSEEKLAQLKAIALSPRADSAAGKSAEAGGLGAEAGPRGGEPSSSSLQKALAAPEMSAQEAQLNAIQNLQRQSSNLNPQLNYGEMEPAFQVSPSHRNPPRRISADMSLLQNHQVTGADGTTMFDPGFLDSIPVSTFDWESWGTYFDKFLPTANQSFETMP
ncbi:hypothetical protein IAT38_007969 [Cryptococcus sp. DSM 104549]